MIVGFKDKETETLFKEQFSRRLPIDIQKRAIIQLLHMNSIDSLESLKDPGSNHLEALVGDRKGQYSIRINKQWRIVFTPIDGGKNYTDVEIVDYH